MIFDIKATIDQMTLAVKEVLLDDAGKIVGYPDTIIKNKYESLRELAEAMVSGEITEEDFEEEIERERMVFEAELLTLEIMGQATAQKAVNSALDVFTKAVKLAL